MTGENYDGLVVSLGMEKSLIYWQYSIIPGGSPQRIAYSRFLRRPWTLKHINSIKIDCSNTNTKIGLPGYHASNAQIFDMTGAVLSVSISGTRYDDEEEISNWDFINTRDNFISSAAIGESYVYTGLSYMYERLQATSDGFYLKIDDSSLTTATPIRPRLFISGEFNVSITNISYNISASSPRTMEYSITMTLRRKI